MNWLYEPDEIPKRKHYWAEDYADFVEEGSGIVGKCPVSLGVAEAQTLLDDAVPYSGPRWDRSYPNRLYAVSDGVVYRATPTNPGMSYHGFPEYPGKFPSGSAAEKVKRAIVECARRQGCEAEVRGWMNW